MTIETFFTSTYDRCQNLTQGINSLKEQGQPVPMPDCEMPSVEESIQQLRSSIDTLLDSNNFNYSLGNILGSVSTAIDALKIEMQLIRDSAPQKLQDMLEESAAGPIEEAVEALSLDEMSTPMKAAQQHAMPENVVDSELATPTFESLGLSKTAMAMFGGSSYNADLSGKDVRSSMSGNFIGSNMLSSSPSLNTLKKQRDLARISFSSVESPHLKTLAAQMSSGRSSSILNMSSSEDTICKSIEPISGDEYAMLDDFIVHQLDMQELNEGVELVNDLLTDKALLGSGSFDSNFVTFSELESLGIQPRHKALLLALIQLRRLCLDGVAADNSKRYRVLN